MPAANVSNNSKEFHNFKKGCQQKQKPMILKEKVIRSYITTWRTLK